MNEQPNLQQFVDHLSSFSEETPQSGTAIPTPSSNVPAIDMSLLSSVEHEPQPHRLAADIAIVPLPDSLAAREQEKACRRQGDHETRPQPVAQQAGQHPIGPQGQRSPHRPAHHGPGQDVERVVDSDVDA